MKSAGNPSLSSNAAEARRVDRVDAERAVREVEIRPYRDVVGVAHELRDDLAEAERDDREVVPTQSQGRQADQDAGDGGEDPGDDEDDPDREWIPGTSPETPTEPKWK